jgi:hypothetical protein
MDMNRQILERGAQYKSENELQLMKSMGLMAEAEKDQFYYNKVMPFMSEMGYAGEQAAGGSANIAGGLQTAYQGWMNNFMTEQYKGGVNAMTQEDANTQLAMSRKKLDNNANQWLTQTPQNEFSTDRYRTKLDPIPGARSPEVEPWMTDGTFPGGEWQKDNPISYPPSWLKYK